MHFIRYTSRSIRLTCIAAATIVLPLSFRAHAQRAATYYVDCGSAVAAGDGSLQRPLQTLARVNALLLHPGDHVLFKRGATCKGELRPQGSGDKGAPIRIEAYGKGPLPRIEAAPTDEAAFRLFNQSFWDVRSLDLKGGRTYGFFAGGDLSVLHHLYLRDLHVHDVGGGPLLHKESGLVVIDPSGPRTTFEDVELDGILADDTTQWAGIFIDGASHVRVRNSVVHDVQGDGIVVFEARDAVVKHSVAWHTGMQESQTIGTPNAIWTWRCTDCTVEDNEAFLTDSPGVDGGSFDIDFGNTQNTVRGNFGHDTVGYCVAVFGAFGPTTNSVVADNLCLNNGMSPRLAQRQGSIFLATWKGGTLNGVELRGNRIEWQPPGDAPALRSGPDLRATGITFRGNDIWSTGIRFIEAKLQYTGENNRYVAVHCDAAELISAQRIFAALGEKGSSLTAVSNDADRSQIFGIAPKKNHGWRLVVTAPAAIVDGGGDDALRNTLVAMKSAALQFGHAGLEVRLVSGSFAGVLAGDWSLLEDGVKLDLQSSNKISEFSVKLVSPSGQTVREWRGCPSPVELGLLLRQSIGQPNFSYLRFGKTDAMD